MRLVERYAIKLDDWPSSAVWRMALGYTIPTAFGTILGHSGSIVAYLSLFLCLLLALRIVPAILRFTLPISPDAKEAWKRRRFLAKAYDSFQWQKLFWIGLGMSPHAFVEGRLGWGGLAVTALCLIGGGAGLLIWHRVGSVREADTAWLD